jgi:hypothetical protein
LLAVTSVACVAAVGSSDGSTTGDGRTTGDAYAPRLNFSDLISGPSTGLGDGLGSGVIVTVWGQHLGSSQGSSEVVFTDSAGNELAAAHVYYWTNADG